jgi:hypothetical protein
MRVPPANPGALTTDHTDDTDQEQRAERGQRPSGSSEKSVANQTAERLRTTDHTDHTDQKQRAKRGQMPSVTSEKSVVNLSQPCEKSVVNQAAKGLGSFDRDGRGWLSSSGQVRVDAGTDPF